MAETYSAVDDNSDEQLTEQELMKRQLMLDAYLSSLDSEGLDTQYQSAKKQQIKHQLLALSDSGDSDASAMLLNGLPEQSMKERAAIDPSLDSEIASLRSNVKKPLLDQMGRKYTIESQEQQPIGKRRAVSIKQRYL